MSKNLFFICLFIALSSIGLTTNALTNKTETTAEPKNSSLSGTISISQEEKSKLQQRYPKHRALEDRTVEKYVTTVSGIKTIQVLEPAN